MTSLRSDLIQIAPDEPMIDIEIVCSWLFANGFKHIGDLVEADLEDIPAWSEIPPRIADILLSISAGTQPHSVQAKTDTVINVDSVMDAVL